MAADIAYFAAKTIGMSKVNGRKPCDLLTAARHNLREIQTEMGSLGRIDPGRSATNAILAGPTDAAQVQALAVSLLAAAGLNPAAMRRDHVQALEFVFSLPPSSGVDPAAYFARCLDWLMGALPLPVLSAVSHADEHAPHLHILLLPLAGGIYAGGKPVERPKLLRLRESFFNAVAGPAGLHRESAKLRGEPKRWAVAAVLTRCEAMGLPAVNGPLWPVLVAAIERDPTAAVRALGIELSAQKDRQTQAEPIPIGIEGGTMSSTANPIGIEKRGEKTQSLSCVGIAQKTTLKTAPEPRPRCERGRQIHADRAQAGADDCPRSEPIQSPNDLWQRVGIRAMALPKIGRAGAVLADKAHFNVLVDVRKMLSELGEDELKFQGIYRDSMNREQVEFHLDRELTEVLLADKSAAGRTDRLSVARAAQEAATTRHAIKPLPVLADPDDDRHVDRSEAQDLHAWND